MTKPDTRAAILTGATTTDRAGAPVYAVELEVSGQWEVYSDHETPAAALMAATALVMDETATAA